MHLQRKDRSTWECELFGAGSEIVLKPAKGREPNWFWRLMQYLILGNRWYRRG